MDAIRVPPDAWTARFVMPGYQISGAVGTIGIAISRVTVGENRSVKLLKAFLSTLTPPQAGALRLSVGSYVSNIYSYSSQGDIAPSFDLNSGQVTADVTPQNWYLPTLADGTYLALSLVQQNIYVAYAELVLYGEITW